MAKELKGLFGEGRDGVCCAWREAMSVEPLCRDTHLDQPFPDGQVYRDDGTSISRPEGSRLPVNLELHDPHEVVYPP